MSIATHSTPSPYKDFSFPLNVYAQAIALEEGRVEYLHYGLFEPGVTDLGQAQAHSTELLLARLPAPPCRILEVGVGLATTLALLLDKGYDIHGITPDGQQIDHARARLGESAPVSCVRLEDFVSDTPFDVILFQESAQYIEPIDLFNSGLNLMKPGGQILIIDEFALRLEGEINEGLHPLDDFIALSARFGFKLIDRLDLSALAAPTLDYLLRVTTQHRPRLCEELALTSVAMEHLDESNRAYRHKYAEGRYGYALLLLKKGEMPRWRLGRMDETHRDEMLNLFEQAFGHRMTPAFWQWKYGAGRGREIGIWSGSQLVAHYGGMPRSVRYFGRTVSGIQIGDVMVSVAERGVLTRTGPFFLMATSFLERYVGFGKPFLLAFGFPQERAIRLAERLGLYAEVDQMSEIVWPPLPRTPKWLSRLTPVRMNDATAQYEIDRLWQAMTENLSDAIIGERDWAYLRYRYFEHPVNRYEVYAVRQRFTGRYQGVIVLRQIGERCELIDLVAPLKNLPLLVVHARRLAGLGGSSSLHCNITERFAGLLQGADGVRHTQGIRIPTIIWSDGPSPETIKHRWWLMFGDTDFQ